MARRIFYLEESPAGLQRMSSVTAKLPLGEHVSMVYSNGNGNWPRHCIAFEESNSLPAKPRDDQEWFDRATKCALAGNTCAPNSLEWLVNFGIECGFEAALDDIVLPQQVVPVPTPGPRKPPRTVIVQQWVEQMSDAERKAMADRAWAATMSLGASS